MRTKSAVRRFQCYSFATAQDMAVTCKPTVQRAATYFSSDTQMMFLDKKRFAMTYSLSGAWLWRRWQLRVH